MSYHAGGHGSAVLKEGTKTETIFNALNDLSDNQVEFELYDDRIDFWESYSDWQEESILKFLDTLIPFITKGYAEYCGDGDFSDGDCFWRYRFYPKNAIWKEERATIVYGLEGYADKELIEELTERGYTITR